MWGWWKIRCRFTRIWLDSYIRRELHALPRAHVARHLHSCSECRARCEERRQMILMLTADLSAVGRARRPRLDAIWRGVERELAAPAAAQHPQQHARAAFFLAALLVMMWASSSYDVRSVPQLANDPPPTARVVLTPTPSSTPGLAMAVDYVVPVRLVLQNTPNTSQSE